MLEYDTMVAGIGQMYKQLRRTVRTAVDAASSRDFNTFLTPECARIPATGIYRRHECNRQKRIITNYNLRND